MQNLHSELYNVERLQAITQSVGFALWQLQALENATAEYFVLVALATQGMGLEAGQKLSDTVKKQTFGKTINALSQAGKLSDALKQQYSALLAERNWLVHSSRVTSQHAVYRDESCEKLLIRLNSLAEEANKLLRAIAIECDKFASQRGVSKQEVDRLSQEILNAWQSGASEELR
jgi:hypothetical protein